MAEFKPINTQEEFDTAITARLKRERETTEKKYEGWLSPEAVAEQYKDHITPEDVAKKYEGWASPEAIAEKDAKIKGYETNSVKMRIAHEIGLPFELVDRLNGEDEASIRKDAEGFADILGKNTKASPLASTEPPEADTKDAALLKMVQGLKGE